MATYITCTICFKTNPQIHQWNRMYLHYHNWLKNNNNKEIVIIQPHREMEHQLTIHSNTSIKSKY
jgi:hypothetical protein